VDAARAAVVAAQEAFNAADAAAAGRRWAPHNNGGSGRRMKLINVDGGSRRQIRIVLESTETATVPVDDNAPVNLKLSYLTYGAHWSPSYDCRAVTGSSAGAAGTEAAEDKKDDTADTNTTAGELSLALTYYGDVVQRTGEDWSDARISLSTAQPAVEGDPPELKAPVLGFYEAASTMHMGMATASSGVAFAASRGTMQHRHSMGGRAGGAGAGGGGRQERMMMNKRIHGEEQEEMAMDAGVSVSSEGDEGVPEMATMAEPMMLNPEEEGASYSEPVPPQAMAFSSTSVSSGTTSTLFGVRRPASIPSDGEPHKLVIGAVDVHPTFKYKTSPRAAAAAFLTAAGSNDSPYPLLPGPVRVFLDGRVGYHFSPRSFAVKTHSIDDSQYGPCPFAFFLFFNLTPGIECNPMWRGLHHHLEAPSRGSRG
jgi:hypothetical protein